MRPGPPSRTPIRASPRPSTRRRFLVRGTSASDVEIIWRPRERSDRLVVLAHGLGGLSGLDDVIAETESLWPDADLMVARLRINLVSNADPFRIAAHLEELIHDRFEHMRVSGNSYQAVVLIGHSTGAALIRKVYLYGMGLVEDHPDFSAIDQTERAWAIATERLVLLAPTTRGWSIFPKPKNLMWLQWLMLVGAYWAARIIPCSGFLKSMERGAPFISNARIQWIKLSQRIEWQGVRSRPAFVVILLGDTDELVSSNDHLDFTVDRNAVFISVPDSDHKSIIEFADSSRGESRARRFADALCLDHESLRRRYRAFTPSPNSAPDNGDLRLIFLLHGIRDYGSWRLKMQKEISLLDDKAVVLTPSYGYLPMLPFILGFVRRRYVKRFMDWYTEAIARHPRRQVSFFGHSNGTYILARALLDYRAVRCVNVAFAGSVVPQDYPWDQIIRHEGRVQRLRNDIAAGDWVVAIFPRVIEQLRQMPGLRNRANFDIGSGGFNGFRDDSGDDFQVHFLRGGHSAAITTEGAVDSIKIRSISKFLTDGSNNEEEDAYYEKVTKPEQDGLWSVGARFSFICILLLIYMVTVTYDLVGMLAVDFLPWDRMPLLLNPFEFGDYGVIYSVTFILLLLIVILFF